MGKASGDPRQSAPAPAGAGRAQAAAQPVITPAEPVHNAADRYWNGNKFDDAKFYDETFLLMSNASCQVLHRDLAGHLFITRHEPSFNIFHLVSDISQVSYAEACAWLVKSRQGRAPEKFLAFFGINPAEATVSPDEKRAIDLCAEWQGMDSALYVRDITLAMIETDVADLELRLKNPTAKDHARNSRFHRKLAPIMAALGWNGVDLADRRAKA